MEEQKDIRWVQRFGNFNKALAKLTAAIEHIKASYYSQGEFDQSRLKEGDDIVIEGVIQRFEYTHELAWNVMKDFLESRGSTAFYGSRDATREAFQKGLIADGEVWMEMIRSRNQTSHTYNEETALDIFVKVLEVYYPAFLAFQLTMEKLKEQERSS